MIVAIKVSLNRGLSSVLTAAFPGVIPYPKPIVSELKIRDPQWLAGFTSAEGCFLIKIIKSFTHLSRFQVVLVFNLSQHNRDEQLMKSLVDYLDCGNINVNGTVVEYTVTKFSDLTHKVIPFFQKYSIQGIKHQDFLDFVSALELVKLI